MTEKKQTSRPAWIDEFHKGFMKSMDAEKAEIEAAPKVHNVAAGEVMHDVDPAKADKFLED